MTPVDLKGGHMKPQPLLCGEHMQKQYYEQIFMDKHGL